MTSETSRAADRDATWVRLLRVAVLGFGLVLVAFFVYAVVQRFRFPSELEWMTGSVLDHVERVRDGKPVYTEPTVDWIPFLYPPLYYWLSAFVARVAPIVVACRLVSLVATAAIVAAMIRLSRRLGATWFWTSTAVGCFFGAYSLTGYWYDIERCDALFVAMVLTATALLVERRGLVSTLFAGMIVGGAYFAKQPAVLFVGAGIAGLLVVREGRRAGAFAVGAFLGLVPMYAWLHVQTDGWFDFYCTKMPTAHGMAASLITVFFIVDLTKGFLLTAATLALFAWTGRDLFLHVRAPDAAPLARERTLFVGMLAAAFAASAASRLHIGGYMNVLMYWSTFACVAVAVIGTELEGFARGSKMGPITSAFACLVAFLQLAHFSYDPGEPCPDARRVSDAAIVAARVRELEKDGPVLLTGRGNVTEPRHFHAAALMDVLRGGRSMPADLVAGLAERRYAAYVVDEFGELTLEAILGHRSELFELVTVNYAIEQHMDDRERPPVIGWIAHPSWVLRPRRKPLTGFTIAQLERRQRIEMGLADMRMRLAQAGVRAPEGEMRIEDAAAAIDQDGVALERR